MQSVSLSTDKSLRRRWRCLATGTRQLIASPLSPIATLPRVQSGRKRQARRIRTLVRCHQRLTIKQQEQNEEIAMNHYEPSVPRVAFGIAAVAMTAITIGVSVIMPANMDSDSREPRMLAASTVTAPVSTDVAAGSASIDVAALHELGSATVPCSAEIEPQARGPRKTISQFHAS